MALWGFPSPAIPGSADTDIAVFWGSQTQPPGRPSIWVQGPVATSLPDSTSMDWSLIVAVEFDEPYSAIDGGMNPCLYIGEADPGPLVTVNRVDQQLAARKAELESRNPKARFWVNFTSVELGWMQESDCPLALNKPYIDVISEDVYYMSFDRIQSDYTWLAANPAKPDQQLALIPGTFYRSGQDNPATQASYVQSYFPYANAMNQSCSLPLADRGVTGYFDGCPVWIVLGFLSGDFTDGNTQYVGELDPTSAPIAAVWHPEFALPLRPGLANQLAPGQIVTAIILPLLLNH